MRISDWSSDVCSSDLVRRDQAETAHFAQKDAVEPTFRLAFGVVGQQLFPRETLRRLADRLLLGGEGEVHKNLNSRSEERRVGNECVGTCRSRGRPEH